MSERQFKLPGVNELNKEQDKILRLPKDGQFLVVGAPGTGKSVVALLRMLKFQKDKDYIFLVYNRVLEEFTKQLVSGNLNSKTWMSWFREKAKSVLKSEVPMITRYDYDFETITEYLNQQKLETDLLHIIIDEGQDMPSKFYASLISMNIMNFFVVADYNQQITSENSTRNELTNVLALETSEVFELRENFRNSHDIARLANFFYTDPSSPRPNLPPKSKKSIKTPILYEYNETRFDKVIRGIILKADSNPKWLIGIITPNNMVRENYINAFERILNTNKIKLDNPKPKISTYSSNERAENISINFSCGGILVLNSMSIKGLEFDIVFIADINEFYVNDGNIDSMRKRFYVMVSRAIKQVILLKPIGRYCSADKILPTDEDKLLERKR